MDSSDPTPAEIARCRRWASLQNPPVTVEDFEGEYPYVYVRCLPVWLCLPGQSFADVDLAWRHIAYALRPIFASIRPIVLEEAAKVNRAIPEPPVDIKAVMIARHARVRVSEDDATAVVDWLTPFFIPEPTSLAAGETT